MYEPAAVTAGEYELLATINTLDASYHLILLPTAVIGLPALPSQIVFPFVIGAFGNEWIVNVTSLGKPSQPFTSVDVA